jgi:hypothetical protein
MSTFSTPFQPMALPSVRRIGEKGWGKRDRGIRERQDGEGDVRKENEVDSNREIGEREKG